MTSVTVNKTLDIELSGTYTSVWEEGEVTSHCAISLSSLSIVSCAPSNDGDHYEHLVEEYAQVKIAGEYHAIEAEGGELTKVGQEKLEGIVGTWLEQLKQAFSV